MINIEQVRHETPGCKRILHFNNAGAALMPQSVVRTIKNHINAEVKYGAYEAAILHSTAIQNFYHIAATLIGAEPEEIAYMENATRAWGMLFHSLNLQSGDRVLTSIHEYGSNYLAFLHLAKKKNIMVDIVHNDEDGQICLSSLKNNLHKQTKLIAITHIPSNNGLVNPAEEIGTIAAAEKIFYLLDSTQSLGQLPINVKKIKCDALCATGRKYLRGPRGTGFLYIKKNRMEQLEPPFIDLHSANWTDAREYYFYPDRRRFETWEYNIANKLGLSTAIRYAMQIDVNSIWQRIQYLSKMLRDELVNLPGLVVHDTGHIKSGIVTFSSMRVSAEKIFTALKADNMNVSICKKKYDQLNTMQRNLDHIVRASLHYYNTEEEINQFYQCIKKII